MFFKFAIFIVVFPSMVICFLNATREDSLTMLNRLEAIIDSKFDKFETKFDKFMTNIETKFDNIETKFDNIETKFDKFETKFDKFVTNIETEFDKFETNFDKFEADRKSDYRALIEKLDIHSEKVDTQLELLITSTNKLDYKLERYFQIERHFYFSTAVLVFLAGVWPKTYKIFSHLFTKVGRG